MRIINTAADDFNALSPGDQYQIYCGLDSCITHEIHPKIASKLEPLTQLIYNFERALQAPVLEMMLTGILTDTVEVGRLISTYSKRKEKVNHILNTLANVVWEKDLNPNSPTQLMKFFYEIMGLPKNYKFVKGEKKLTVDRESLEKLQDYRYARPIVIAILASRDLTKKIGVLRSGIDDDKRMRFSYNIAGTNTGRFSSNKNVFGGGTNAQNITDELRRVFIAEPDWKFAYLDLEQAESRFIAYVSGDEEYIKACESSDLHVYVARLIWLDLNWTNPGGNVDQATADRLNREVAEEKFWRHWSRRDLAKRGGHLTNYVGQAFSNAKNLHISIEVMKHFQTTYMEKFSGIKQSHTDVARELSTTATITTPLGRKRLFFGRNYADDTLRKAVAYRPQSGVGDLLNLGMYRVWKEMKGKCKVLAQLHDAILITYKDEPGVEAEVIQEAKKLMTIPIQITDIKLKNKQTRTMIIPVAATVGWNWAKQTIENPDGLISYTEVEERIRQESPEDDLLRRVI